MINKFLFFKLNPQIIGCANMSKPIQIRRINGKDLTEDTVSQFLVRGAEGLEEIKDTVQSILFDVKSNGDSALKQYTEKFDNIDYSQLEIRVSEEEIDEAFEMLDESLIEALKEAKQNIHKFHKAQYRSDWFIEIQDGVKAGQLMRPISDVGLYVPGGKAVYPSSVLMTAVPAKVAGVKRLVVCSPPQADGKVSSEILVASRLCEVDEVLRIGGAQAIGALAYGTESIKPVQKIVGPGNKWVAAAKQLVANVCGIDNPAGPSEVLVIDDGSYPPKWSAFDILAQSEHGPDNVSILLSESWETIEAILEELNQIVEFSPRREYVQDNLEKFGLIIDSNNPNETLRLLNLIAAEHLQLNVKDARDWLPKIQNAGAVFLGGNSPVPLGDYCAGTNHVLPTAGYARMYSGLSLLDFVKVMDVLECEPKGLQDLYQIMKPIAEFEGLVGHRDCVKVRLEIPSKDKKEE